MKLWIKWTIIIVATVLVALIAGGVILVRRADKLLPDLYAQWATAELIIAYRRDHNRMPINWEDLRTYFPASAPHHNTLSFVELQNRINVEFDALPVLERSFKSGEQIPEVIRTRSGTDSHWQGAEPNELVNAAFAQ